MPSAPKPACPKCRRKHCDDPTHKAKPHGWDQGNTRQRRPEYSRQTARRRRTVALWCRANCERTTDGKWYGTCEECGKPSTQWVADHIIPVMVGGLESGELDVHCRTCSDAQGSRLGHAKRWGRD